MFALPTGQDAVFVFSLIIIFWAPECLALCSQIKSLSTERARRGKNASLATELGHRPVYAGPATPKGCVCACVCVRVCACIAHVHTVYMYVCAACTCVHARVCVWTCVCVHMRACMCVCSCRAAVGGVRLQSGPQIARNGYEF